MKILAYIAIIVVTVLLLILFGGALVYWLWPIVMKIFTVPMLTYWESVGLYIVCSLLFKDVSYTKPPHRSK